MSFDEAYHALQQRYKVQPKPLGPAVSEFLANKGKWIRPQLCMLIGDMFGGNKAAAMPPALATEMVHMYSLIHDDLPCMDDAASRRNVPTLHVRYGEAMAVLLGDALLSDAFHVLASWPAPLLASQRLLMSQVLAEHIGSSGMVLGQVWDSYNQPCASKPGKQSEHSHRDKDHSLQQPWIHNEETLLHTYHLKTSRLFCASVLMGYYSSTQQCDPKVYTCLKDLSNYLGLTYQLRDDLKDRHDKHTKALVEIVGIKRMEHLATSYFNKALEVITPLPNHHQLKDFIHRYFS
ncbi:MAG: polyprenyl synthetase family protein [Proteobacteria bacterium]|nr:polyprenyl synthetase family protein [Pseudomonadota bacterium]